MPSIVVHPKCVEGRKNFLLDVEEGASGGDTRTLIAARLALPAASIRLKSDGKFLKLGPSLADQGVHNLSTVSVELADGKDDVLIPSAPVGGASAAPGDGGRGGGGGGGGEGGGGDMSYPPMDSPMGAGAAVSGEDSSSVNEAPPNSVRVFGEVPESPQLEEALEASMCLYGRVSTVTTLPSAPDAKPTDGNFLVTYVEAGGATTAVKAGSVMLFGKALSIEAVRGASKAKVVVTGALAAGITVGRTSVRKVAEIDEKLGASRRVKVAAVKVATSAQEFSDRTGITKTMGKVGTKIDEAATTVATAATTKLSALDQKYHISEKAKSGAKKAKAKSAELATKAMSVKAVSKSVTGVSNLWRRVKRGVSSTVRAAQNQADARERASSASSAGALGTVPPPPVPDRGVPSSASSPGESAPSAPSAPSSPSSAVPMVDTPEEMDVDGLL